MTIILYLLGLSLAMGGGGGATGKVRGAPPSEALPRGASGAVAGVVGKVRGTLAGVVDREGLKPCLKPAATADAIYAF